MSVITIQLGQCGNQIGEQLFETLATEAANCGGGWSAVSAFFREGQQQQLDSGKVDEAETGGAGPMVARSLLIDMEPKVVARAVTRSHKHWAYDEASQYSKQSGSANNWAYGYLHHGPNSQEPISDLIRRELERTDVLAGFMLLHSVAGGTGSGVGTYVSDLLRSELPKAQLLNCTVWPYESGEVIVQNFNSLLTTSHLTNVSDGIILFENDSISAICTKLLHEKSPSFKLLNDVIALHNATISLPALVSSGIPSAPLDKLRPLSSVIDHLCAHPAFKLLTLKAIPQMPPTSVAFSTHTWAGLLKHLRQMQIADSPLEEGIRWGVSLDGVDRAAGGRVRRQAADAAMPISSVNKTVAGILMLRGTDLATADVSGFQDPRMYAPWALDPLRVATSPLRFNGYEKTATFLSNSQSVVPVLDRTITRAKIMYDSGAYLHQYQVHGLEPSDFEEAFASVEQILADYQSL